VAFMALFINRQSSERKSSFKLGLESLKMVRRICRDCPVPNCGAKYLVRLANHLADVHSLDIDQRRQYLQDARLQPKIKCVEYQNDIKTRDYQCKI